MLAPSRSPNGLSRRVSIVYLGIVAFLTSATSMALPQGVLAQIPVTGGRAAGDGAFFVPDRGNTVLFDTSLRFLRLETPNGVTVNSRFTPNGGYLNPTTGVPEGGETGILSGTLSGRAFSADGTPVFFQGITTNLNFTLNAFDANRVFPGTLIAPTNNSGAPLVFLQTTGANLSSSSSQDFAAVSGSLHIGQFSASLSGGSIDLPSTVRFAPPATDNISLQGQEFAATANTTFELEGRGDGVTTVNRSNNQNGASEIGFDTDNGTTKFRIEGTVGSNSRQSTNTTVTTTAGENTTELNISGNKFELEGTITGPLNFTVSGVSPTENSSFSSGTLRGDTSYQLSGSGRGTSTLDARNGNVSFHSEQSDTNVSISVGDGSGTPGDVRSLNATGTGEAAFNVGIGLPTTGSGSTTGGNIFNANPTPTNTDFGSGFVGVGPAQTTTGGNPQLPNGEGTPSEEKPTVNIPAAPSSPTLPGGFLPDDPETPEPEVEAEPAVVKPPVVVTSPNPPVPTLPNAPLPADPVVSPTPTAPVVSQPSAPTTPSLPSAPAPEPVAPPVVVAPEPVAPPVVVAPEPVAPPVVVAPEPVTPPVVGTPEPVAVVPTPDAEVVPTVDPLERLMEEQRSVGLLSRSASTFISAFRQTPSRQYVPVGPRSRVFPGLGGVREAKNVK
ncbi:hypothetical protein [[Phormidium] sp. ETS-05]|uniref:hypothetical protein n=1 Tax=[Phormidium] sp. ETS-05 TaxID=222819 RepID=UPI0018EED7B8|nr:hypothetical protein [[Phormidium] sp. ETS-05]